MIGHDKLTGEKVMIEANPEPPLVAYVFKVYMDEGRRLVYLRIYAGTLAVGQEVFNTTRDSKEKISRIFQMHAHHKQRIESASAGDLVAVMGLKDAITGDTLSTDGAQLVLEPIDVLKPVIAVAIEPKSSDAAERLSLSMRKMMEEDPTIKVEEDPDTGQVILEGMGELHLEIALDRFRTTYGVDINVGKPQVLYCSTVSNASQAEVVFDKKIGEVEHHGHVVVNVAPVKRGEGNVFELPDGNVDELRENLLAGLKEACLADPVFGFEVVDTAVRVSKLLVNDKTTPQGIKIASQMALHDALRRAEMVRLEPIMELDALVPEEHVGDVVGDLSARKSSVEGVTIKGKYHSVKAFIPLSQTFGYSTQLRSLTRGRGSFNMRFAGFDNR